jgi:hypothetical protein
MSEHIWKEFRGVVRHASGQETQLTEAAQKHQCGVTRADAPICRVQERLFEKTLRARAMDLVVPDMGDRWLYWVVSVTCGLIAVGCVLGPAFWGEAKTWWSSGSSDGRFKQIIELYMGANRYTNYGYLSFGALMAASAYGSGIMARSKSTYFRYKVFLPVPDAFGGALKWDYYLTSALPPADVETLSAAGGGKAAALASRSAAKYQGALSIAQARIKCRDAIEYARTALRGGRSAATSPDAAKEVDRMVAACGYVDDATEILRGVQTLCKANAIDAARLSDIVAGKAPSASDKLKDLARRFQMSRAQAYLDRGQVESLPADPAYLDQASITLEVALPKIGEAERAMTHALENMRSLGDRLKPAAASMNYLDDPRYAAAVTEALSGLPSTKKGSGAMLAVKSMSDDDVLKADAALAVASATMDYTILPSVRGGDIRIRKVTNAYYWTVVVIMVLWAVLGIQLFADNMMERKPEYKDFNGTTNVWYIVSMFADERRKGNLPGSIVTILNWTVKGLVFLIVVTAVLLQLLSTVIRYDIEERGRITMFERLGDALRKMVALGGVRGALKESEEFSDALANLDLCMTYDVLTDKGAHGRMPVRISALVVGVLVVTVCAIALYMMVATMQPHSDFKRMRQLQMQQGRGAPVARAMPMPVTPRITLAEADPMSGGADLTLEDAAWGEARDAEVLAAEFPNAVKGPVIVAGIVSLVYYFVLMIMTEARTRDLYVTQLSLDQKLAGA